ncbi:peptide antibiotic transporter SbmA [Acinetobacter nematophilus]|uniref:peptide antibiotic transporter SbmA n=1 Tax=Acinetobacter nematophilus TaxID=2994642 RepID=UPI003AF5B328
MFKSFFPNPRLFFGSLIFWICINFLLWNAGGDSFGEYIGLPIGYATAELPINVTRFWSFQFLWFYLWFAISTILFASFWKWKANHIWQNWSILGSAFILFNVWFSVQVSVLINAWYGPFWDLIQTMLSNGKGDIYELYERIFILLSITMLAVTVAVLNSFFVSHYIFRWRTAINFYYISYWAKLRRVEGAAQRVQEDIMRFTIALETLGVGLIKAIIILLAFLPILVQLSEKVSVLPIVGEIKYSLVWAAIGWALLGTMLLIVAGVKLPGLEFNNQKVEAAYRKELVYGEDYLERAKPQDLHVFFNEIRKNYFRMYLNYVYFHMAIHWYAQLDILFSLVILFPSIVAGVITLGVLNQISHVFDKVRESFQYLINSWKIVIEIISIYKRLSLFESIID